MNHGLTLIVSFFSFVQTSFREFGEVGSDMYTWGIKDFHKCCSGSLAKRSIINSPHQYNKLHSTICIVLLSEFVSQNAWLQHNNQRSKQCLQVSKEKTTQKMSGEDGKM